MRGTLPHCNDVSIAYIQSSIDTCQVLMPVRAEPPRPFRLLVRRLARRHETLRSLLGLLLDTDAAGLV